MMAIFHFSIFPSTPRAIGQSVVLRLFSHLSPDSCLYTFISKPQCLLRSLGPVIVLVEHHRIFSRQSKTPLESYYFI